MVVQSAHHPVKTYHLPRNIYDNKIENSHVSQILKKLIIVIKTAS